MAIKTYGSDLGIGREQKEAMILLKCLEEHKKMGDGEHESSSDDVSCDGVVAPKAAAKQGEAGDSEATDDLFEATQAIKSLGEMHDVGTGPGPKQASNDESSEEVDEYTRGIQRLQIELNFWEKQDSKAGRKSNTQNNQTYESR